MLLRRLHVYTLPYIVMHITGLLQSFVWSPGGGGPPMAKGNTWSHHRYMVLYRDNQQCHKINGPRGPYGVATVLWRTVTGGNNNWQLIKKLWFKYTYLNTSWIKILHFITYLGQNYRLLYKRKCVSASAEVAWWSV